MTAEEANGLVRWLRPAYQNKKATAGKQAALEVDGESASTVAVAALRVWPDELPAQAAGLSEVLASLNAPAEVDAIAAHFDGKKTKKRLEEMTKLLETLAAVGRARITKDGWLGA